jgi:hypothetical protein
LPTLSPTASPSKAAAGLEFNVTSSPTTAPTQNPTTSPTATPSRRIFGDATFQLIDANSQKPLKPLSSGSKFDSFLYQSITIKLYCSDYSEINQVVFQLSSISSTSFRGLDAYFYEYTSTSNPFSMTPVDSSGGLNLSTGQYSLSAMAYSSDNVMLDSTDFTFSAVEGSQVQTQNSSEVPSQSTAKAIALTLSGSLATVSAATGGVTIALSAVGIAQQTTVVTQTGTMFVNLFHYMQFLGSVSLMAGNGSPDFYRQFLSGFTWTLGLVHMDFWSTLFGSWFD